MIDEIENDPYKTLATAIIAQAVKDYANAVIGNNNKKIKECERFFRSEWFVDLNSQNKISGKKIISSIRDECESFRTNAIKCYNERFISEERKPEFAAYKCPLCGADVFATRSKCGKTPVYKCKCSYCLVCVNLPL